MQAVASGAIASDYQRLRVENVSGLQPPVVGSGQQWAAWRLGSPSVRRSTNTSLCSYRAEWGIRLSASSAAHSERTPLLSFHAHRCAPAFHWCRLPTCGTSLKRRCSGKSLAGAAACAPYRRLSPLSHTQSANAAASVSAPLQAPNMCSTLSPIYYSFVLFGQEWHNAPPHIRLPPPPPPHACCRGMITSGIQAVLVKVAAMGLEPHKHLGKTLAQMEPHLHRLREVSGSAGAAGEGRGSCCAVWLHHVRRVG